ncbi:MAG: chromosomal replication initiator protein DnaA, partial [Calditrichaeota bacterium]
RIEFVVASLPGEEAEEEVTPDIEVEITIPESSPSSQLPCDLNHRFQFSNFFVGVENELAKKAAMAVVETPDLGNFNPLVIYGGMGTGKTHLLHAIGNRVKEKDGAKNIILFNSDLFLNQYVFALQNNQLNNFISRLLSADWLLIDDIHLLSGKLKTQEGFLYIASLLLQRGKQIVVTTNISPGVMENFNPRLIAFLQSGLIVDIPPSEQATREQIIRYHFQENNIQPREEVVHFLAENLVRNLHDLHAVLVRIIAQISLLGKEMTLNDVRYILSRMCPQAYIGEQITPTFKQISIEDVVQACSEYFKIPTDILTGVTRKKRIIKARQITIYLCRELTQESLNSIGYHFSDIHHASVLYAYKKVEEAISKDPMIKNAVQSIRAKLIR